MTVFVGTIWDLMKDTIKTVVDDTKDNVESKSIYKKWCHEMSMRDHYEDDIEMGGPGLASEKGEGVEMATGTLREGYITRYIARTFALRMIISEEAMEDCKYKEAISFMRRLKRSMWKTVDIDCANMLVRGYDTAYVGGDGKPLWSTTHTLPHGGSFSNVLATAQSPSRLAVIIATSQCRKFPGHDGITEGVEPTAILCPTEQWGAWAGIVKSTYAPDPGIYNEINVVNSELSLEVIPNKFWSNTTTNWAIKTDCDPEIGFNIRWRRRPRNKTWEEPSQELASSGISARWARGWSDPRCTLGSQA